MKMKFALATMTSILALTISLPCFAETFAVDSAAGTDLSIGAGNTKAIIVGGGSATSGIPVGSTNFLGSVGIGTTNPQWRLQLDGEQLIKTDHVFGASGDGSAIYIHSNRSANSDYLALGWVSEDVWGIGSADAATWKTIDLAPFGGSVGVATTAPQAKLDVAGDIRVGETTDACSTAKVGALRRNGTGIEECNGTKWSSLGSAFQGWTSIALTSGAASGTAATDGFLVMTSGFNTTLIGSTSGVERFQSSGRDKYGQGYNSMMMPVKKGETWGVSGASTVFFMAVGS